MRENLNITLMYMVRGRRLQKLSSTKITRFTVHVCTIYMYVHLDLHVHVHVHVAVPPMAQQPN